MLQNIRAKLAQKLSILVVDLYLMRRRALSDHNVAGLFDHAHTIRIQELTVSFAALAEFEFETSVFVEYLYAMRVGVGHDDVVVGVYGDATGLSELTVRDAELAKFTVIDHFGASQL